MIEFLNTEKLIKSIPDIIKYSNEELIIIVPFISLSKPVADALKFADKKGVEITIICRLNEVKNKDIMFLKSLKNINVFSHPNVHSKCYYNEENIIITSLNLTSYSERNNREMGVLVSKTDFLQEDEEFIEINEFEDCEEFDRFAEDLNIEIQQLLNGSEYELKSIKSTNDGFKCSLIRTQQDKLAELCSILNKTFGPKKFLIEDLQYDDYIICENYFDKINLRIKDINQRIEFEPNKGSLSTWKAKFKMLHSKEITIDYQGEKYEFAIYLNKGAKLNVVGFDYDIDLKDRLEIWKLVLKRLSKFFTPELLKI